MPDPIHYAAQRRDIIFDGAGRIHLSHQNRAQLMRPIRPQRRLKLAQINRRCRAKIQQIDLNPHGPHRSRPAMPEIARGQHQCFVPPAEHIRIRRFPGGMTIADIKRHIGRRACHVFQIWPDCLHHLMQCPGINIR